MTGDDKATRVLRVIKVVAAVAIVGGAAYFAYNRWGPGRSIGTGNGDETTTVSKLAEGRKTKEEKKPINFETASRAQTIELLRDIVEVNKQLNVLMEKTTAKVIAEKLDLHQTYALLKKQLPIDPLEKHGVSIADFDQLLARFEKDTEVQNLVVEVIQAGGSPDASSPGGAFGTGESKDKAFELTPDTVVAINAAMRDRLKEIADQLVAAGDTLEGGLVPRTASLTAQALVGAFVQQEYGYTAEDVERAMNVHNYELSRRDDFLAINEEIQKTMQRFLTSGLTAGKD